MTAAATIDVSSFLDTLTPAQRSAVEHLVGPQLVLAGPGSGKTRVVTCRVAYLLSRGIAPWRIVALTFTNKAADEMRARIELLAPGRRVWISTFHRFCAHLLRRHARLVGLEENFTIYDSRDSVDLIGKAMKDLGFSGGAYKPDRMAHTISDAKTRLITPEMFAGHTRRLDSEVAAATYAEYQSRLLAANAVDFDDLLVHVALLLRDNEEIRASLDQRYQHILVDEYQDTNLAQYLIVRALSRDFPNLSVTGDPDQAIYGWRGADLNNILDFEHDYPQVQVVRLEQNYRSTGWILSAADSLISRNVRRKRKRLFTENDQGEPVRLATCATHEEEASQIAREIAVTVHSGARRFADFAIVYRVNALSRTLEQALAHEGVPYLLVNSVEFYQRKEIKDVLAYLKLINNPRDEVALRRVINNPPRGIGAKTVERLDEHARRYGVGLLEAARESGLIESLTRRAAVSIARFVALYDGLCERAGDSVEALIGYVFNDTGYKEHLTETDDRDNSERVANVEELLTDARKFDEDYAGDAPLEPFLERTSLVNDTDDWETTSDRVAMMTLHSAKGLEFPVVYIIAVEENLLPHSRSKDDPAQFEEERRLLFVGMTRAGEQLRLSRAVYRDFRGDRRMSVPSPFLMELPRDEMHQVEPDGTTSSVAKGATARSTSKAASPTSRAAAELVTAAELTGQPSATADDTIDIDRFTQGMIVKHAKWGIGKVVALSGVGDKRKAVVNFVTGGGRREIPLASGELRPTRRVK